MNIVEYYLTTEQPRFAPHGKHPFQEVTWITRLCGTDKEYQVEIECPQHWSQQACDIAASRYMRRDGVPKWDGFAYNNKPVIPAIRLNRETSIKQLIHRLAYFLAQSNPALTGNPSAQEFYYLDLCHLMVQQIIGFNTPAWINGGLYLVYGIQGSVRERFWFDPELNEVIELENEQIRPGMAACYLTGITDSLIGEGGMYSYLDTEMRVFAVGAGNGANVSHIRGRGEPISGGGVAEGLLPFLKIPDASAGYIKSGGVSRRAARMLVCNDDHPDILEFVNWKGQEEDKAQAMADGYIARKKLELTGKGLSEREIREELEQYWRFITDYTGDIYATISGQQANNSVMCSDAFLEMVSGQKEDTWAATWRTDPNHRIPISAKKIWDAIIYNAWKSGCPGILYKDTINAWNTVPHYGMIETVNPCHSLDNQILTPNGFRTLKHLVEDNEVGPLDVIGFDERSRSFSTEKTTANGVFLTKKNAKVYETTFSNGIVQKFTDDHRFLTESGYKELKDISDSDVVISISPTHFTTHDGNVDDITEYERGVLAGWWYGDGTLHRGTRRGHVVGLCIGKNDMDFKPELERLFQKYIDGGKVFVPHGQKPETCQVILSTRNDAVARAIEIGLTLDKRHFCLETKSKSYKIGFIRGLISSDGTIRANRKGGWSCRSLEIYGNHREMLQSFAQTMMEFGIKCSIAIHNHAKTYTAKDGKIRNNKTTYKIATSDSRMLSIFPPLTRFKLDRLNSWKDADKYNERYNKLTIKSVEYAGREDVYDITVPATSNVVSGSGAVAHNCAEITQPNYTTCNLCTLNLLKFEEQIEEGYLENFIDTAKIIIMSLETITHACSHPTRKHAETTYRLRPLGANMANIGAYLLRKGLPYDSDTGRDLVGSIVALFTAACWSASNDLATALGPYPQFNKPNHDAVINKHIQANKELKTSLITQRTANVYNDMYEQGQYRNDAVTCMVPTGTIGLVMDLDTFGMEPELSFTKHKKLADGGFLTIINQSVPVALKSLGYDPSLSDKIFEKKSVVGIVKPEHESVFDCSYKCANGRYISIEGHIDMMAAIQPNISMSISKTGNLPSDATMEDVSNAYLRGWKKGLKAMAIYRDGSKMSQPVSALKQEEEELSAEDAIAALRAALK